MNLDKLTLVFGIRFEFIFNLSFFEIIIFINKSIISSIWVLVMSLILCNIGHYGAILWDYLLNHDLEDILNVVSSGLSNHSQYLNQRYSTWYYDFSNFVQDLGVKLLANTDTINSLGPKFLDFCCACITFVQGVIGVCLINWDRSITIGFISTSRESKAVAIVLLSIFLLSLVIPKLLYYFASGCTMIFKSVQEISLIYDINPIYLYILSAIYIYIIVSSLAFIVYQLSTRYNSHWILKIFSPEKWTWLAERNSSLYMWIWILSLIIKIVLNITFWTSGLPLFFLYYNLPFGFNILDIIFTIDFKNVDLPNKYACNMNPSESSSINTTPDNIHINLNSGLWLKAISQKDKAVYTIEHKDKTLFIDGSLIKNLWDKNVSIAHPDLCSKYAWLLKRAFPDLPSDMVVRSVQTIPFPVSNKYDFKSISNVTEVFEENKNNAYEYERFNIYRPQNDKQSHWFFTRLIRWICAEANSNKLVIHNGILFNRETHDLIPLPSGNFIDTKLKEVITISSWFNSWDPNPAAEINVTRTVTSFPPMFLNSPQELDDNLRPLKKFGNTPANRAWELDRYPLIHELMDDLDYSWYSIDKFTPFKYIRDFYCLKIMETYDILNNKMYVVVIVPIPYSCFKFTNTEFHGDIFTERKLGFDDLVQYNGRPNTDMPMEIRGTNEDWSLIRTPRDFANYLDLELKKLPVGDYRCIHDKDLRGIRFPNAVRFLENRKYYTIAFFPHEQQFHKVHFIHSQYLDSKDDPLSIKEYKKWIRARELKPGAMHTFTPERIIEYTKLYIK